MPGPLGPTNPQKVEPSLVNNFLKSNTKQIEKSKPINTNTSLDIVGLNQNPNMKKISKAIFDNDKSKGETKNRSVITQQKKDTQEHQQDMLEVSMEKGGGVKNTEGKECEALNNLDEVDNFFIDDFTSKQVMQFIPKVQANKSDFKGVPPKELREGNIQQQKLTASHAQHFGAPYVQGNQGKIKVLIVLITNSFLLGNANLNQDNNANPNPTALRASVKRGKSPLSKNILFSEQKKRLYSSKGRKFEIKNNMRPYTAITQNNRLFSQNMSPKEEKNKNLDEKFMPRIEKHNRPQTAAIHKSNTSNNIINININFYNVDLNKKYFNPNEIQKNLIYINENLFKKNVGDGVKDGIKAATASNFMPNVKGERLDKPEKLQKPEKLTNKGKLSLITLRFF